MKKSLLCLFIASALPASSAIILDTEVRLLGNLFFPPDNQVLAPYDLDFDVNQDGRIDFSLIKRVSTFGLEAIGISETTGVNRFVYSLEYIASLDRDFEVGPILTDLSKEFRDVVNGPSSPTIAARVQNIPFGEFFGNRTSYLGFEFQADTGTHYGYLQIVDQGSNGLIIERTAWESTPGKSILTGAIPESTTPALLAVVGIFGLARRSRAD